MKLSRALWMAAVLVAVAAPLPAQTLFGRIPAEDPANRRDVYRMRVQQQVTMLLGQWKRAWDANNDRAAADLYTRDGRFVTPSGDEATPRDSLRAKLTQVFAGAGALRFSLQDFEMSGEMAYVRGLMAYSGEGAAAAGDGQADAFFLVALRQRDDVWLIRSLTLVTLPTAAAPAPAGPASASAPPSAPPAPTGP